MSTIHLCGEKHPTTFGVRCVRPHGHDDDHGCVEFDHDEVTVLHTYRWKSHSNEDR